MKANLIIMTATPGSGKSTFARNFKKTHNSTNIVSRDDIRFSLLDDEDEYFAKEKEVFRRFVKDIQESLSEYNYTIADATHLNEKSRAKLLNSLDTSNVKVISCFLEVPLNVALRRNENRAGTRSYVPITAMENMNRNLSAPKLEEGFDELIVIKEGI